MRTTKIEWTDKTWNPITGCTKKSPGCAHCYAEVMARRLKAMRLKKYRNGFELTLHEDDLEEPLQWKNSHNIFVCSMSDIFHEDVPFEFVDRIMETIRKTPQHRYQILTKRSERMVEYFSMRDIPQNVWLGVTVECLASNVRIDDLRALNATVKFLSCEPLIEDLGELNLDSIDWVIVGGESGPKARPMKPDWVENIKRQVEQQGAAFFFKQWGTWGSDGIKRNKHANGKLFQGEIIQQMPEIKTKRIAYLQCLVFLVLFLSSCAVDRSKYLRVYSGDYCGLCGIELGMVDGSRIEAFIYSHDFVGHRSDVYEGTYAYNPPFITVHWDDKNADVDIRYMIYDENNDRIIAYGQNGIYYLPNENNEKRIEHDRIKYDWKSLDNNIDMDTCDYYILEKNSFTNEYVTDRQELLLPDGYHISYNQILTNILKQSGHEDGYGEALVFDDSYDILNYEDDTLKIVFERMCIGFWKDPNGKPRNSIRDYSIVPKIIYDKRKRRNPETQTTPT